jgi:hypothetical protein
MHAPKHTDSGHGPKYHDPEYHGPESHGSKRYGPEYHGPNTKFRNNMVPTEVVIKNSVVSHDTEYYGPNIMVPRSGSENRIPWSRKPRS